MIVDKDERLIEKIKFQYFQNQTIFLDTNEYECHKENRNEFMKVLGRDERRALKFESFIAVAQPLDTHDLSRTSLDEGKMDRQFVKSFSSVSDQNYQQQS